MPESDTKSRQTSASPSIRSHTVTAASNPSRPTSRINTASSRKTITRSGHKARHTKTLVQREDLADGITDKDAEGDSDEEDLSQRAPSDFLDFGGFDVYSEDGWDTDLEAEPAVEKNAHDDVPARKIYLDACKTQGVIPVSYFLRHLNDTSLDLKHHGLGSEGMKPLADALVTNTSILKLNLEDNWLDVEGGRHVCEMLKENCYITELDLSDNRLGVEFAQQFIEVVLHNNTLTHITLAGNLLNDRAAEYLAEAVMSTSHLEYLDLRNNKLGEAGGIALAPALAENSSIRYLDLSWNNIRRKGAVAIANGIKQNVLIQTLNLSWNGFGLEGAKALGEALKVNSVLEDLDVSNNRLTTEAAVLLGKGLFVNETLKVLKMGKNPIQSAGCFAICAAIVRNPSCVLNQLDFSDVLVNADFLDIFKKVKDQLPDIQLHHGGDIVPNRPKARIHPIMKLKNYMEKHSIRPGVLFSDTEHTMLVPKMDFVKGVQSLGINFTDEDIGEIINELDVNSMGIINYSELVLGPIDFTEKEKKMASSIKLMN